ncbi:MAG: multicopper oxidase domain-containing protein, partial [Moorea sp. SIO3G5]|nr:multicopper oxidase domain-containing protein [Moorena sp. SIO3G5]
KLQFLRKLLIATLISIFVLVSSFPGEVYALSPSLRSLNKRIDIRRAPTGRNFQLRKLPKFPGRRVAGELSLEDDIEAAKEAAFTPYKCDELSSDGLLTYPEVYKVGVENTQFTASEIGTGTMEIGHVMFGNVVDPDQLAEKPVTNEQIADIQSNSISRYTNDLGEYLEGEEGIETTDKISPTIKVNLHQDHNTTFNLTLTNNLDPIPENDQDTTVSNFHYHGFHVSPQVGSDNVLMELPGSNAKDFDDEHNISGIVDGNEYTMSVEVPKNHQPGLNWYHAHPHGNTYDHVKRGLAGTIIVDGIQNYYDFLQDGFGTGEEINQHQVMVFQNLLTLTTYLNDDEKDNKNTTDIEPKDDLAKSCQKFIINNQYQPEIEIAPGEVQFWRLANIDPINYLNLALAKVDVDGEYYEPQPLFVLALDSYPTTEPLLKKSILLPPGSRAEVLVGNLQEGQDYKLISIDADHTFNDNDDPYYKLLDNPIKKDYIEKEKKMILYPDIANIAPSGELKTYNDFETSDPKGYETYIQGFKPEQNTWLLQTPTALVDDPTAPVKDPKTFTFDFIPNYCGYWDDNNDNGNGNGNGDGIIDANEITLLNPDSEYCEHITKYIEEKGDINELDDAQRKELVEELNLVKVFAIKGEPFPETDQIKVNANKYEDWTLINNTSAHHTFHIHQTHFVVTKNTNCDQPDELTYRDNIDLRAGKCIEKVGNKCITVEPVKVEVRIPFAQTQLPGSDSRGGIVTGDQDFGEFVFHCHILAHEDSGMMRKVCASDDPDTHCIE